MNKIFTAAAAALIANATAVQAQEEATPETIAVEISPKHFKFQGIMFYNDWRQANFAESAREATFIQVSRKAAIYRDTKAGIEVPMTCEALSAMEQIALVTQGPKKFIREIQKGEDALGCPKPPLI